MLERRSAESRKTTFQLMGTCSERQRPVSAENSDANVGRRVGFRMRGDGSNRPGTVLFGFWVQAARRPERSGLLRRRTRCTADDAGRLYRRPDTARSKVHCRPDTAKSDVHCRPDTADALVASALARDESRGGHYREDHPIRDDANWLKHTLATRRDDGDIALDYKPVKMGPYVPMERKY